MSWACIHFPQLALDGVLRRHPHPGQPLALVTGPAQKRVLAAVNPAAARTGLHAGQALAAAHALLSQFAMVEHDADEVARWRGFLAAWAYRYSSQVTTAFDDAIVLEIGASLRLFGPWPRFERQLREDLGALGFAHHIALAPNPRAAWVLAGMQDGLALTQPSMLATALSRIPVAQARLDAKTSQALHAMGLRRLGQLFAAPRASLARRSTSRRSSSPTRPPRRAPTSTAWACCSSTWCRAPSPCRASPSATSSRDTPPDAARPCAMFGRTYPRRL